MSEFKFACPNCSQSMAALEEQAGKSVQCPTCKHPFIVPTPPLRTAAPQFSMPSRTRAAIAAPPIIHRSSSAVPPVMGELGAAPPPIGSFSDLERQVLDGGRFVVFQYCFSVLVMTFKRASPVMFLRGDEEGARSALTYSLISLGAGWWGIPWGPIWTISTIITNLGGGKDLTQAVLTEKLDPVRAAQIMAQRRRPSRKGCGLLKVRLLFAMLALAAVLALAAPFAALLFAGLTNNEIARGIGQPGQAQFKAANEQIAMYRGSTAFGNSAKAIAVASRFSSQMRRLRAVLFEGGKSGGISLSQHEFLTCCELQENQCAIIVHVPELRHFTDSAKSSLGTLAWDVALQALETEQAGKSGMKVAVGLRGFALYDRVLIGTFTPEGSGDTNGLTETITGSHPEKSLLPWFQAQPSGMDNQAQGTDKR